MDGSAATSPLQMPICDATPPTGKPYGNCFRFVHEPEEPHESIQASYPGTPDVVVTWTDERTQR